MTRTRRAFAWASGIVLAVLPASGCGAQGAPATDDTPVRAVLLQLTDAWNGGDPRGAAAMFTDTGTLIAGDGAQTTGRVDIEQYLDRLRGRLPRGTRFTSTVTSLRFLNANVALLQSEGGFLMPEETTVTPERRGVQSIIIVREGGAWQAALFQRTRILPYAPPSR